HRRRTGAPQGGYAYGSAEHGRLRARCARTAVGRGDDPEPPERERRAVRPRCARRVGVPLAGRERPMTAAMFQTHEVRNQSPPLEGYDAYGADPWLRAAVPPERVGTQ